MLKDNLLISDLAKETGVSVRTIRYYIMEGLLPSPQVRGRYSVYDDTYLHRIRLIKILKDAYLPLSKIRELLSNLTPEEIKSTLENYEKEPPLLNVPFPANLSADMASGLSAKEYIRRVRDSQGPPSRPARLYQSENLVKAQPKTPVEPELDIKGFSESIEELDGSPSTTLPAFLRDVAQGVENEENEPGSSSQNWVRIEVAPGIELNIREDVYQRRKHQIEELLKLFKG